MPMAITANIFSKYELLILSNDEARKYIANIIILVTTFIKIKYFYLFFLYIIKKSGRVATLTVQYIIS